VWWKGFAVVRYRVTVASRRRPRAEGGKASMAKATGGCWEKAVVWLAINRNVARTMIPIRILFWPHLLES
jgi:hypothetical protein